MKQSNGSYKVSKIVLPIISNKVIVYTNYSDVKNGILRIATVVGGVIKTDGNKDVNIAVNYQNQRKEVEKIEKIKEVENYLFFIYDIGYHTTPVTYDVMSK
ncbi:hypothetical protein [Caldicellulosiruptor acetigenus]|uniref:hypothetical protein n=1 Tax=Caldicellulosiruptor acetigenus TaxID=301953 RepID=UPI0003FA61CB|nr:hypothetical protein [Caldicellulosiruptor acetigenus]WAM35771.1 hypothetical protein OTK01_002129 [Caldicellulosiruptor acetigenus]